jgi:predicted helicase
VFLTNALSGWEGPDQIKVNFPELQQEHEAARKVKRDAKIIVILGNPPYNRFAGTALDQEADLVDHYKGIRRREKVVQGKTVMVQEGDTLLYTRWGIRKQLLDDLYIRFFRLAEKRIGEKAEDGVVSYISNSSYLTPHRPVASVDARIAAGELPRGLDRQHQRRQVQDREGHPSGTAGRGDVGSKYVLD